MTRLGPCTWCCVHAGRKGASSLMKRKKGIRGSCSSSFHMEDSFGSVVSVCIPIHSPRNERDILLILSSTLLTQTAVRVYTRMHHPTTWHRSITLLLLFLVAVMLKLIQVSIPSSRGRGWLLQLLGRKEVLLPSCCCYLPGSRYRFSCPSASHCNFLTASYGDFVPLARRGMKKKKRSSLSGSGQFSSL